MPTLCINPSMFPTIFRILFSSLAIAPSPSVLDDLSTLSFSIPSLRPAWTATVRRISARERPSGKNCCSKRSEGRKNWQPPNLPPKPTRSPSLRKARRGQLVARRRKARRSDVAVREQETTWPRKQFSQNRGFERRTLRARLRAC